MQGFLGLLGTLTVIGFIVALDQFIKRWDGRVPLPGDWLIR